MFPGFSETFPFKFHLFFTVFGPFFLISCTFTLSISFFALFCLQNSRKYSKTLENTILVAQFYNTSIFTSKASHSHIGGNIIFVRVLEDKNLRSHNIYIPLATSVSLGALIFTWGGWIVFNVLTTLLIMRSKTVYPNDSLVLGLWDLSSSWFPLTVLRS